MTSESFVIIAKAHSLRLLPHSLAVQTSPTIRAEMTGHLFFLRRHQALPHGVHNVWFYGLCWRSSSTSRSISSQSNSHKACYSTRNVELPLLVQLRHSFCSRGENWAYSAHRCRHSSQCFWGQRHPTTHRGTSSFSILSGSNSMEFASGNHKRE